MEYKQTCLVAAEYLSGVEIEDPLRVCGNCVHYLIEEVRNATTNI